MKTNTNTSFIFKLIIILTYCSITKSIYAQSHELFEPFNGKLSKKQAERFTEFKKSETLTEFQFIKLKLPQFDKDTQFIHIGKIIPFDNNKIVKKNSEDVLSLENAFVWYGEKENKGKENNTYSLDQMRVRILSNKGRFSIHINNKGYEYRLSQLDKDIYLISRVNVKEKANCIVEVERKERQQGSDDHGTKIENTATENIESIHSTTSWQWARVNMYYTP